MSKAIYENLLKKLNNARAERKLTLAKENGYETVEAYKQFLNEQIASYPAAEIKTTEEVELTDLVIAFDTTGSMGSYILAVKEHVKTLIPNAFRENRNLQVSIIAFGDWCDVRPHNPRKKGVDLATVEFGNAYQVIPLTTDENALIKFVQNAQNTSGGDIPEFYEVVMHKLRTETAWRDGATRNVLFIGDCEPHDKFYYQGNNNFKGVIPNNLRLDWEEEINLLVSSNILVDTLSINGHSFYKTLAEKTGGVCLPFSQAKKTGDLIEATVLARGGSNTRSAFATKSMSSEVKADVVMSSVYESYSKEIIK